MKLREANLSRGSQCLFFLIVIRLTKLTGHWLNYFCLLKPGLANKSGKWFGHVNLGDLQVSERPKGGHVSDCNVHVI